MTTEDDPLGAPNPLWLWSTQGKVPIFGLGDTAELANWIGRVVAGYSALEFNIYWAYAIICGDTDAKESFARFYSMRSINTKERLFQPHLHKLPPEYQEAISKLWRFMRGAATRRTEIAHSALFRSNEKMLRLQMVGDRAWLSKTDKAFFVRTTRQFRTLQTDSQTLLSFLYILLPDRWEVVRSTLPVPPNSNMPGPPVQYRDSLPPSVEAELLASRKRLALDSVVVMMNGVYGKPKGYILTIAGHTTLWYP